MVECGAYAVLFNQLAYLLGALPAAHIHNGAALYRLKYMYHFGLLVKRLPYNIGKVFALEAHLEHIVSLESQLPLYIVHHLWCSRSRKCQYRNIRFKLSYVGNMQIRGTEVVTPL